MSFGRFGSMGVGFGRLGSGSGGASAPLNTIIAGAGAYLWSGDDMATRVDHVLVAGGGTYTYTGQDASFLRSRLVAGDAGTYNYTGQDATLTKGSSGPTRTKTASPAIQDLNFGSSTATFSSVAVNNTSSSDLIIVEVSNSARQTSGVTIGGNAMTKVVESNAGGGTSIWKYTGSVLTTPNIVVTSATGLKYVGITVVVLTGVNATETSTAIKAYGTTNNPQVASSSLTVPATGFGLAVYGENSPASGVTWNTGTEDTDITYATNFGHSSAYFTASATPSVTGSAFAGCSIAAAAWGP